MDARRQLDPEEAAARITLLDALLLGLGAAQSPEEVCEVIVRETARALGAAGAAAWYLDGAGRTALGATCGALPAGGLPSPDLGALSASRGSRDGDERTHTVPLLGGGTVVGAVALVGAADDRLLDAIVRAAGEALARARAVGEALRLATVVETSADALLALAPDGTILSWNPAAERMSGWSAQDAIGTHATLVDLDDVVRPALERLQAGGTAEYLEVERVRKDGASFLVALTLSPVRDERGVLTSISATARDITAERQAEQRLRRLAAIVETSPSAVVVVATDTARIVECNPAAERLLGLSRDDVLGRHSSTLESGPDCGVVAPLQEAAARGEVWVSDDVWRVNADGARRRLHVTGYPVPGPDGTVTAAVIVMDDITETSALEEALRQAQRLEALGRLAGGVAHDVNNMLTVISGYAQIARSYLESADGAEALDEVSSATRRVQRLTRQLLAFARRESVEPTALDIPAVVEALLPMLRSLVGGTVRLRFETAPDAPLVLADRAQIEQVLVNLVVNARDAMPRGGDVHISIAGERSPAGDEVVLTVADTGHGMTAETMERIFEPFFTTKDAASNADGAGTGLGLATVHGAVSQAGGRVEVTSTPGSGTRFTIRLPAATGSASPAGAADGMGAPEQARAPRILVCDDEPVILRLVERWLGDSGYEVTALSDPRDALAAAERAPVPFDLLVTDVLMPGMTGPELAESLLTAHAVEHVVFISGFVDDSFAEGDRPDGMLLGKPFTKEQLVDALRGQLDEAGGAAA